MKHANDNDIFRWSVFLKETGLDELTEDYSYVMTKEKYLSLNPHSKRK